MSEPIIIELSGEPKGAGRPRFVRATGVAFTPADTRRYQSALRYAGQEAMNGRAPLDGPLRVSIVAAFPIPQSWSKKKRAQALTGSLWPVTRPDADNIVKQCDALNEIVWRDDKQIVSAEITKRYSDRPALSIMVTPI